MAAARPRRTRERPERAGDKHEKPTESGVEGCGDGKDEERWPEGRAAGLPDNLFQSPPGTAKVLRAALIPHF